MKMRERVKEVLKRQGLLQWVALIIAIIALAKVMLLK